jgi:hypothetical protein
MTASTVYQDQGEESGGLLLTGGFTTTLVTIFHYLFTMFEIREWLLQENKRYFKHI